MSAPVDPVMRLDHCFAVLVVPDVIHWEWGPMKQKVCRLYTFSWHGNAWIPSQGGDSPSVKS